MLRFTLFQLLGAVAVLALAFALVQSEGCGVTFTKIHSLAFSPDGKRLAVVTLNFRDANVPLKFHNADLLRTISLVEVDDFKTQVIDRQYRPGNHGPATQYLRQGRESLAFSDNGASLFFPEFGGGKIQRFDLNSGNTTSFFNPGSQRAIQDFALSPDRTMFAATIWNGGVSLLSADDAKQVVNNPRLSVFSPFRPNIGLSSDNRWMAILDMDNLRLFDTAAKLRGEVFPGSGAFAFGPRADQLAVADESGIVLYDLATTEVRRIPVQSEIFRVQFLGEGKLVVVTADGVILLNADSGQEVLRLAHFRRVTALATYPREDLVAFGGTSGNVTLWNVADGTFSTFEAPGRSRYPWTLPAAGLALLFIYYVHSLRRRSHASVADVDATQSPNLAPGR